MSSVEVNSIWVRFPLFHTLLVSPVNKSFLFFCLSDISLNLSISFSKNFAITLNLAKNNLIFTCLLNFIYTCHFCFIKNNIYHLKRNWPHFRLPKFCCNSIYHHVFMFLKIRETHFFENFLWKGLAVVKLQVYTNAFLKINWLTVIFEGFILELKCHKTYFEENLWVAASMFDVFNIRLFLNFANRAEGIWWSDN